MLFIVTVLEECFFLNCHQLGNIFYCCVTPFGRQFELKFQFLCLKWFFINTVGFQATDAVHRRLSDIALTHSVSTGLQSINTAE